MMRSRLGKWLVVGALVTAIVAVGAVGVGVAGVAAQTLGPGDGAGGFLRGLMMGRWNSRGDSFLAEELGVTVEELAEAREAAQQAALAEAVAEGELTQEQADLLQAHQALRAYLDPRALMGEMRELKQEGLDFETLREQMQALRAEAITQALADGAITQAQADALLESEWGPMMGGGPRGRMQGGFRGGRRGTGDCPGMWNRNGLELNEGGPEA
jgi:hypothetical protein